MNKMYYEYAIRVNVSNISIYLLACLCFGAWFKPAEVNRKVNVFYKKSGL